MFLIVGLGNPGPEYSGNRHNIGFMAVDRMVRRHSFSPWKSKFQAQLADGSIDGEKCLVLKPQTYMNLSGQSVAAAARFHKIPVDDIIVLHDELDLAPGRVRVKRGGGAGGHNGLKSIDQHMGQAYRRVRLGIGHPGDKDRVSPYVLGDFAKADQVWLDPLLDACADHMGQMLTGDETGFMSRLALAVNPPKPKGEKKPAPAPQAPVTVPPQPAASQSTIGGAIADALRAAFEKRKG